MGPATPVRVRLALAIAVSIALHTAIILAVHPSRGAARQQGPTLTARLIPAMMSNPENERRDPTAAMLEPDAGVPANATLLPTDPARVAETSQDPARRTDPAPPAQTAPIPPPTDVPATAQPSAPTPFAGGPLPAPRYYLASELERRPTPQQPVEPENPPESGGREGSVVLRLLINERGAVDDVTVVRAEPSGVFEKSALAAFGRARFSPGMRSGVAVKSQLLVEVQYRLDQRTTSGRGY